MENKPTEATQSEEKKVRDNIMRLTKRLALISSVLSPVFFVVMGLVFFEKVPFFTIIILMMLLLGLAAYLVYTGIKCPRCKASPFSSAGFKSHPFCHNCGLRIDDRKTVKEQVAEKYPNENLGDLEWEPLNQATSNFDSHRLIQTKTGHLAFRATRGYLLFIWVFILVGLLTTYFLGARIPKGTALLDKEVLLLLIPLLFAVVGFVMLYFALQVKEFNLSEGVYKRGKEDDVLLMQVNGLQILSHEVTGDESSYTNYQLNLVLHDKNREGVVSYANKDNAIRDAERLSSYLGVKLWKGFE